MGARVEVRSTLGMFTGDTFPAGSERTPFLVEPVLGCQPPEGPQLLENAPHGPSRSPGRASLTPGAAGVVEGRAYGRPASHLRLNWEEEFRGHLPGSKYSLQAQGCSGCPL